MKLRQLFWICLVGMIRGKWNAAIYFDTEARTYGYHLARVGRAYLQDLVGDGSELAVMLHEERAQ